MTILFGRSLTLAFLIAAFFTTSCTKASETVALSPTVSKAAAHQKAAKSTETAMWLDKTTIKQGDFISAFAVNVKDKPTFWFNAKAYKPFKLSENKYRALIPVENLTTPGNYAVKFKSGSWVEKIPVTVVSHGKEIQHIHLTPGKSSISATKRELNAIGGAFQAKSKAKLWKGKFAYPSAARKSSPFGVPRSYNKAPVSSYHKGLDFAGDMGSPVYAPADGKVIVAGKEKRGFKVHGNTIILDHGHAVTSIYMHMSKFDVENGASVKKGQKLGEIGHTGISTGPHLHWGVYLYGTSIDPENFISKEVE